MMRTGKWISAMALVSAILAAGCDSGGSKSAESTPPATKEGHKYTIGVMPKLVGIPYFTAMEAGAKEAGKELGVEVVYDGPVTADTAKQVAMVESWIARKFDAIIITPNDPAGMAPVLKKARDRGIRILTADADAQPDDREFFVSQATDAAIAKSLVESLARGKGESAKYLILTGSLTAANQNAWIKEIEKYQKSAYPNMVNLSETPKTSEEDQALATQVTIDALKAYPSVQGILAITSVALPGAAEALRKEGAAERVFLTGLATPNAMKEYVKDGTVREFTLWNPTDLGYLAVVAANAALKGDLKADSTTLTAGRLGSVEVNGGVVLLGKPTVFDKSNIDKFNF